MYFLSFQEYCENQCWMVWSASLKSDIHNRIASDFFLPSIFFISWKWSSSTADFNFCSQEIHVNAEESHPWISIQLTNTNSRPFLMWARVWKRLSGLHILFHMTWTPHHLQTPYFSWGGFSSEVPLYSLNRSLVMSRTCLGTCLQWTYRKKRWSHVVLHVLVEEGHDFHQALQRCNPHLSQNSHMHQNPLASPHGFFCTKVKRKLCFYWVKWSWLQKSPGLPSGGRMGSCAIW